MATIASLTLDAPDPAAAEAFSAALDVGAHVIARASQAATAGFRGFTLSLVVSQPNIVDTFIRAALDGGATPLEPARRESRGYGDVDPGGFASATGPR